MEHFTSLTSPAENPSIIPSIGTDDVTCNGLVRDEKENLTWLEEKIAFGIVDASDSTNPRKTNGNARDKSLGRISEYIKLLSFQAVRIFVILPQSSAFAV